jgi:short subunit dehydrogenase-like uncharacterized protein
MTQRKYDVILWGATGFTGQIVAAYLTKNYGVESEKLRWAMAGRSPQKLEAVREEIAKESPEATKIPLVIADSDDIASLQAMAAQATVICTTVGPYARYGAKLVAACIAEGTHYCDLTGEVQWIRRMIDEHHEEAAKKQLRIVNCCGYDSIPSDIGVLMVQEEMKARHGVPCEEIKFYAGPSRGSFSGGTVASMLNLLEEASKDKSIRRVLGDPYSLLPKDAPRGQDGSDQMGVRWDDDLQRWTAPFVMAGINTRIVRRSNALMGFSYGQGFRYSEVMAFRKGVRGWYTATSITLGLGGFLTAAAIKPIRRLLAATVLPAPGQGPSKEAQENGYFTVYLLGKAQEHRIYGFIYGSKDPGYGATAIMLAESAICLARDTHLLPERFGLLTPASAMGMTLTQRLRQAGLTLEASTSFRER